LASGIMSCENPKRMQELANGLTPARILLFLSKWQNRLPAPFTVREQRAGYRHQASISQVEFALTQVFDQPVHGRIFFEVVRQGVIPSLYVDYKSIRSPAVSSWSSLRDGRYRRTCGPPQPGGWSELLTGNSEKWRTRRTSVPGSQVRAVI
jgi:hypothetical protein